MGDNFLSKIFGKGQCQSGGFDTLPTFEVPRRVLQAAIAATKPIGDGLYGVDVKEIQGRGYVIEVNDNPRIDRGVEDKYLGDELYMHIMSEFLRRMQLNAAILQINPPVKPSGRWNKSLNSSYTAEWT